MLNPWHRLHGEVPERSNGAVSKTVVLLAGDRGFESLPLRQNFDSIEKLAFADCLSASGNRRARAFCHRIATGTGPASPTRSHRKSFSAVFFLQFQVIA